MVEGGWLEKRRVVERRVEKGERRREDGGGRVEEGGWRREGGGGEERWMWEIGSKDI